MKPPGGGTVVSRSFFFWFHFMKLSGVFRGHLQWLNLPGALLVALLQRAPALPVIAMAEERVASLPAGAVLRSAFATVASLGGLHSLAGATSAGGPVVTQLVSSVNQPARATVGSAFAEQILFYSSGVVILAESWSVSNTLPPGVAVEGGTFQGGRCTVNTPNGRLILSGTPAAPGTYSVSISGYQYANLTPPVTTATATIIVAAAVNAPPAIIQSPSNATVLIGLSATFSVLFSGAPAPVFQ